MGPDEDGFVRIKTLAEPDPYGGQIRVGDRVLEVGVDLRHPLTREQFDRAWGQIGAAPRLWRIVMERRPERGAAGRPRAESPSPAAAPGASNAEQSSRQAPEETADETSPRRGEREKKRRKNKRRRAREKEKQDATRGQGAAAQGQSPARQSKKKKEQAARQQEAAARGQGPAGRERGPVSGERTGRAGKTKRGVCECS